MQTPRPQRMESTCRLHALRGWSLHVDSTPSEDGVYMQTARPQRMESTCTLHLPLGCSKLPRYRHFDHCLLRPSGPVVAVPSLCSCRHYTTQGLQVTKINAVVPLVSVSNYYIAHTLLTSSTDPNDPVPSILPVVVTPLSTNCCSCMLFLKAWPKSVFKSGLLLKKAMATTLHTSQTSSVWVWLFTLLLQWYSQLDPGCTPYTMNIDNNQPVYTCGNSIACLATKQRPCYPPPPPKQEAFPPFSY